MDGSRDDELEKVVGRVKDVLRAKVVRGEDGKVQEVRVLTQAKKSVQKVAKDVTSAIRAQGEDLESEHIHISQVASQDWSELAGARIKFQGLGFETFGITAECRVVLALGDRSITGSSKGIATARESLKLVARATLDAISMCLIGIPETVLEGVSVIPIAGVDIVLVMLSTLNHGRVEYLSGSCPVKADVREAVCRATLSAFNRKLALLARGAEA